MGWRRAAATSRGHRSWWEQRNPFPEEHWDAQPINWVDGDADIPPHTSCT